MTVLDADFDIDLAPAEGDEVPLQVSVVVPERQPPDWASLLKETEARVDEEWARANVAELRREELRRSEREARSVADSLTRQLETCRAKLKMAAPKTLTGTVKALERRVESQDEEIAGLRLSQRRSWEDAERTEARHQDEINWLKQDLDKARSQIAKVFQEGERVAGSVRRQFGAARRLAESREGTIAWLRERNDRLRAGVARATALIASLRESNRGLRAEVRDLKDENAAVSARQAARAHGQQPHRAHPARPGHRAATLVRFRQREGRGLHRHDVFRGQDAGDQRHRRPALAEGLPDRLRGERRQGAGRPVALAAMVDERGAPTRTRGAAVSGEVECRYHGRDFTVAEMKLIRELVATEPSRAAIARAFCRRTGWLKPDGGLKAMMAKVVMLKMHRDGIIKLPPPKWRPGPPKPVVFGPDTEPPLFPVPATLDEARPLEFRIVKSGTREGRLWNEFVARYHYLGYTRLVGAQMRYAVHDRNGWPLAMLGLAL